MNKTFWALWSDGFILVLEFVVLFVLARYIAAMHSTEWRKINVDAAISFFVYFLGELIIRSWIWFLTFSSLRGYEVNWSDRLPGVAFGTVFVLLGSLCCMRVFAMAAWGPWVWIAIAGGAASLSFIFTII